MKTKMHKHYLNQNDTLYYLLSIERPHRIWYPMNVESTILSDEYIEEKYGITNPRQLSLMRGEFLMASASKDRAQFPAPETCFIYYDGIDYPLYLFDRTENSVLLYIEKGLFTLYPRDDHEDIKVPRGYPWAVINKTDSPEYVAWKLYDGRPFFGHVVQEMIWK